METISILSELSEDKTLLLVDDDRPFLTRLERAMESAASRRQCAIGRRRARLSAPQPPAFAVVDLRLEDGNGLDVMAELHGQRPDARAWCSPATATSRPR